MKARRSFDGPRSSPTRGSSAPITSPPCSWPVVGVQVGRLLQAGAEPAADRRPALPLAVVSNQVVGHRRDVERVFDLALLERAGGDPAARVPAARVPAAWWSAAVRPPGATPARWSRRWTMY